MDTTPAERRERYKTALRSVRMLRDGKNQDRQADVVTALADDEIADALRIADAAHDAKVRELEADNARLRAQAAEVRAAAFDEMAKKQASRAEADAIRRRHSIATARRHVAAELREEAAAARPDCAVCHQPADSHPTVCYPPATRPADTTGA